MDNQVENAAAEQGETVNQAVQTVQSQAQQAGEQTFAAARDFGDNLRAMMEKSLHETRTRYEKTKGAMGEATASLEASLTAAQGGMAKLSAKAFETFKADAEAQFSFLASLASAKSPSEMVTMNTEFVRKRIEDATARAKTFSEFARQVTDESTAPIREQLSKKFNFAS